MVNLDNYKSFPWYAWYEEVIAYFGKEKLESAIEDAMIGFFSTLHKEIVCTDHDDAIVDDEVYVHGALGYILQNTRDLFEEE